MLSSDTLEATAAVADALEIEAGSLVHLLETLGMIDGRPISVGAHYFPADRFPDLIAVHLEEGSITRTLTRLGCGDYERRSTRISARMPEAADADFLEQPRTRPILHTESVNVDGKGIPVEYGIARFAADRFQFIVET